MVRLSACAKIPCSSIANREPRRFIHFVNLGYSTMKAKQEDHLPERNHDKVWEIVKAKSLDFVK